MIISAGRRGQRQFRIFREIKSAEHNKTYRWMARARSKGIPMTRIQTEKRVTGSSCMAILTMRQYPSALPADRPFPSGQRNDCTMENTELNTIASSASTNVSSIATLGWKEGLRKQKMAFSLASIMRKVDLGHCGLLGSISFVAEYFPVTRACETS